MRVVFVENHDSFSWNVLALLPAELGEIEAVRGGSAEAEEACRHAELVVVGPGPMDPERAGLVRLVRDVIGRGTPLLGICLGHQAIGLALGARLERRTPAHGKVATATFTPGRWLPGVEGPLQVMRYHSLSLVQVPPPLRVTATLADGTVMAVEHESRRVLGLQFHPDSYATPSGPRLVRAFLEARA